MTREELDAKEAWLRQTRHIPDWLIDELIPLARRGLERTPGEGNSPQEQLGRWNCGLPITPVAPVAEPDETEEDLADVAAMLVGSHRPDLLKRPQGMTAGEMMGTGKYDPEPYPQHLMGKEGEDDGAMDIDSNNRGAGSSAAEIRPGNPPEGVAQPPLTPDIPSLVERLIGKANDAETWADSYAGGEHRQHSWLMGFAKAFREAADALEAMEERAETCERFELRHRQQIDVLLGEQKIRDIQIAALQAENKRLREGKEGEDDGQLAPKNTGGVHSGDGDPDAIAMAKPLTPDIPSLVDELRVFDFPPVCREAADALEAMEVSRDKVIRANRLIEANLALQSANQDLQNELARQRQDWEDANGALQAEFSRQNLALGALQAENEELKARLIGCRAVNKRYADLYMDRCAKWSELRDENKRLKGAPMLETQVTYMALVKENKRLRERCEELGATVEEQIIEKRRLREALEKIAKPALGGYTQQGIARAALGGEK